MQEVCPVARRDTARQTALSHLLKTFFDNWQLKFGIFPEFIDGYGVLVLPTTGRYFQVPYGALVPRVALDIPEHGWVNLHFSVLPSWRVGVRLGAGAGGGGAVPVGFNVFTFAADKFLAALNALASENRVNVLSNPSIMTAENRKAVINVSTSVPIVTSQQVPVAAGGDTGPRRRGSRGEAAHPGANRGVEGRAARVRAVDRPGRDADPRSRLLRDGQRDSARDLL